MNLTQLLTKILGDPSEKYIKRLGLVVEEINQYEEEYQKNLTLEDIPTKTAQLKQRLTDGVATVDDVLPEAFALVKFACRTLVGRTYLVRGREMVWDMIPYDVQLIGGIVLHQGKIAEMKTGEGKTLVSSMPVYLNALLGKGVHVVTVNDYLAQRDAEWMGELYRTLGLTVGVIIHGQSGQEKNQAYACDITYGTNNEFGFDYLRDNMAIDKDRRVQRPPLHYAIVDEVDSILIDEARTPLIISAPAEESTEKYNRYSNLIGELQENTHYAIDEKAKTAVLTEEGIAQMEKLMGVENIYTERGFEEVHHIEQALKAKTTYKRDVDYVVQNGEIVIVDEFTGRLMPGRRYSQGLHQAIEAKENVAIQRESRTLATITFQNYFRLYQKLAGMTGTAATEAEEFATIYGLDTIAIPTHRPLIRKDLPDLIYKNTQGKYIAIAKKVKELNEKGQPALIGTISVEKSEMLSKLLSMQGIKHNVLNAKQHEREAEIVAEAGQRGSVTIATNMAGRGTDIKLGEGVTDLGGLYIIGTERHESRRIDNQLRGRSGRQGDPGNSQFYLSMEDDLMRLFGSDKILGLMDRLGMPDDMPIENRIITRSVESAQKKVEGRNFDIRKHLVEYDDAMNKHREIMYRRRNDLLDREDVHDHIVETLDKEANELVMTHSTLENRAKWNYGAIAEMLSSLNQDSEHKITEEELRKHEKSEDLVKTAQEFLKKEYEEKERMIGVPELMRRIERAVTLRVIDTLWMRHIDDMSKLRENVALRGYGQRDPLIEYKNEAFQMFTQLLREIQQQTVNALFKVKVQKAEEQAQVTSVVPQNAQTNQGAIENTLTTSQIRRIAGLPTQEPMQKSTMDVKPPASTSPTMVVKTDEVGPSNGPSNPPTLGTSTKSQPEIPHDKVGRNDPCFCGSEKKYKKCHGAA